VKKIAEESTQVSATVPTNYAELLDEMGEEDQTNRARHVRLAIQDYLEKHGKLNTLFDAQPRKAS